MTIVAAWMRALTGVGPSIASGSHVWSGICADLATAPPRSPSATSTASVVFSPSASGAAANTVAKSRDPICWMRMKSASAKVASPTAFMMKAFLPAATASRRRCQ